MTTYIAFLEMRRVLAIGEFEGRLEKSLISPNWQCLIGQDVLVAHLLLDVSHSRGNEDPAIILPKAVEREVELCTSRISFVRRVDPSIPVTSHSQHLTSRLTS